MSPGEGSDGPARVGLAGPGSTTIEGTIDAIGTDPRAREDHTGRARRPTVHADDIGGVEPLVEYVSDLTDAEMLACCDAIEGQTLDRFATRFADGATGVAVLLGDPNGSGYQYLGKVERAVDRPVRVTPRIASIQVAASHARTPPQASTFGTRHQRRSLDADRRRLGRDAGVRRLLVLPRPYDWMPADSAALLEDVDVLGSLDAPVFERSTLEDEGTTRTLNVEQVRDAGGAECDDTPFADLAVPVVGRAD